MDDDENLDFSFSLNINYEIDKNNIKTVMKNGLNFVYINMQSFRNKLNSLENFLTQLKILVHVIILVEINIKSNEMKFYNLENYSCYHSCRKGKSYGGVAIYVHKSIESQQLVEEQMCFTNFLVVELIGLNSKVIGVYNPPDTNKSDFIEYFDKFLSNKQHSYIFGDFNINLLDSDSHIVQDYTSTIESNGFSILNKISSNMFTRSSNTINTLIDHAITDKINDNFLLYTGEVYFSDHRYLLLNVNREIPKRRFSTIEKINYSTLKNKISALDLNNLDFDSFHNQLCLHVKNSTEKKTVVEDFRPYQQPWFRNELLPYLRLRDKFYKLKKNYPSNDYFKTQFFYYKHFCAKQIERDKIEFNTEKIRKSVLHPRKLWQEIGRIMHNKKTSKNNSIMALQSDHGILTEPKQIANSINKFFVEVPNQLQSSHMTNVDSDFIQSLEPTECLMNFLSTNRSEIETTINNLKLNSAAGYDKISTNFIRESDDRILNFIVDTVNKMFDAGEFPDSLKIAKIFPIFKDGDKRDANNYRPIAVLPILSKIFETTINTRILNYLSDKNLLNFHQFGFRKGSNTASATINLVKQIVDGLEKKKKTACLFIDLRKAFDCVNHKHLLKHLWRIGFRGKAYNLLKNYLTNRRQFVRIGNTDGDILENNCGVPQGSILGPTLFIIYINEIFDLNLNGNLQLYADDAVLTYHANSYDDLYVSMSSDLRILNSWFKENHLTLNTKKTQFMIFKTKNTPISNCFDQIAIGNEIIYETKTYKYLGLWLDSNLNFGFHIGKIKNKVAPMIGALKKIRRHVIPEVLDNIYFAHIHSHLTYLICLWGMAGSTKIKVLERLQNKSLKNLKGLPYLFPTSQLYSSKILPISCLKDYELILIAYKMTKNKFKHNFQITYRSDTHNYRTRNSHNINLPQFRLNIGRNSFSFDAFKKFNEIPVEIRNTDSYACLKKYVKNHLFEKYTNSFLNQ
jgi:exonuclease III